jgi:hypothetical protein
VKLYIAFDKLISRRTACIDLALALELRVDAHAHQRLPPAGPARSCTRPSGASGVEHEPQQAVVERDRYQAEASTLVGSASVAHWAERRLTSARPLTPRWTRPDLTDGDRDQRSLDRRLRRLHCLPGSPPWHTA